MKKIFKRSFLIIASLVLAILILSYYAQYQLNQQPQFSEANSTALNCADINSANVVPVAVAQVPQSADQHSIANKIIPDQYRASIATALAHYPELRDTHIEFVVRKTLTPLESRPFISTIFGNKSQRRYQVIINPEPMPGMQSAMFESLSETARAGAIGHELGHTLYYESKSTWELVLVGLAYPWGEFRKKFERSTDVTAIAHCLGDNLLQWSQEIHSGGPDKWNISGFYLSPVEIEAFIQK